MTTITIERELLEQAVESFIGYRREMRLILGDEESEPCDAEKALRAALAAPATSPEQCGHCGRRVLDAPWPTRDYKTTAPAQPAWHDAPTVPGL